MPGPEEKSGRVLEMEWLLNSVIVCNFEQVSCIVEKEMATHSSILAWGIPWTEEPGGLQSIGSQRIKHD